MLKITVVACLIALCVAQPPPEPVRPSIPETFYATYHAWMSTTDRFGHTEVTGQGFRAYDMENNRGVRNTSFQVGPNQYEFHYKLQRYDLGRNFDAYPINGLSRCDNYPVSGPLPGYWNWLQFTEYDGRSRWRWWDNPAELDWWRLEVSGESYRLGVFPENPHVPAVYERKSEVDNWHLSEWYESFGATTPRETDFDIPRQCTAKYRQAKARFLQRLPVNMLRGQSMHSATTWRRGNSATGWRRGKSATGWRRGNRRVMSRHRWN